ncbi:matrix-remodeling-associated protein 7 [Drosophila bipectinata]|uniref:matrix-remodeling-associated protein 7 n=1 Tax=Drosophila bipectinata TaxID=42026 RepID=UPI001C8A8E1E|nr:matrix-remodeling-associated protein 7 [Drosophila bipectinata]
MQDIFPSLDGFGLPGNYSIALTTLLLCVLAALYFANFFKDKTDMEDEGLGTDEPREEDSQELTSPLDEETDDDEAYGEDTSDSDLEFIDEQEEQLPQKSGQNYPNMMGQLKAKQFQEKLVNTLTPIQIEEERRIEREQLAAIFELLRKQESELNLQDRISDKDLKEQVRLYR